MAKYEIDRVWFDQALINQNKTQTDLGRHLGIHKSAVSRILSGDRKMQTEEATAIARFLSFPVNEVLKHAGLAYDLDGQPTKIILAAMIDDKGNVNRLPEPRPLPQALIDKAHAALAGSNARVIAAQIRADKGPLAVMDDAVILFRHTETVEQEAMGNLAICRLHDGSQILAKIERSRKTGEAHIIRTTGEEAEVVLDTATPVIVVLP